MVQAYQELGAQQPPAVEAAGAVPGQQRRSAEVGETAAARSGDHRGKPDVRGIVPVDSGCGVGQGGRKVVHGIFPR